MDFVSERTIDLDAGSDEGQWRRWLARQQLAQVDASRVVDPGQRAVVVAPHPDDEVLMVGGLMALWAELARPVLVVAVTDGEGSHPGSTRWPAERLARERIAESELALSRLGSQAAVLRVGVADGQVATQRDVLTALLLRTLTPSDIVFTTWALDGHPDHEATAVAARRAARATGARLYEVPVWGWHWARPGDGRMPWSRALHIALAPRLVQRKCAAVHAFRSQWEADPSCPDSPVLRPSMLRRAQRGFELVFA